MPIPDRVGESKRVVKKDFEAHMKKIQPYLKYVPAKWGKI